MRRYFILLLLLCGAASRVMPENTSQFDRGTPPQHAAGVSVIGSYMSADLGTINLGNGALNISLPIGQVGGRGLWVPLNVHYTSKIWSAMTDGSGQNRSTWAEYDQLSDAADINGKIGPGWTIGAAPMLKARGMGLYSPTTNVSGCSQWFADVLVKLTLVLPDKGEVQFRDDQTDGNILSAQLDSSNCRTMDGNRGTRWHATDGSGMIFLNDNENGVGHGDLAGVVITSEGTRYRFDMPGDGPAFVNSVNTNTFAVCTKITDRNGNTITVSYPDTVYPKGPEVDYTDPLGRVTRVQRDVPDPGNSGTTLAVLVDLPGFAGQRHYYKIKRGIMNANFRSDTTPVLPVINGDADPLGYGLGWGTRTALFPGSYGTHAERIDGLPVINEMVLPDGRSMSFFYNEYGEVSEARLPTGGKLQYDYAYVPNLPVGNSATFEAKGGSIYPGDVRSVDRAITARRVYPDGAALQSTWTYSYSTSSTSGAAAIGGRTLVRSYSGTASGALILNEAHTFMDSDRDVSDRGGTGYSLWTTGLERRIETRDTIDTVLKATERDWYQRVPVTWGANFQIQNDNRVTEERNYLENGNCGKTTTSYDYFSNPLEITEYDYNGSVLRRKSHSYVGTYSYLRDGVHLIRLPEQEIIADGQGTVSAQTVYEYDNHISDQNGNNAPLLNYAGVSGHDADYGTAKIERGNATRVSRLVAGASFANTYSRFDILGNVVSVKDPRSYVTQFSFEDDFGDGSSPGNGQPAAPPTYAFATKVAGPPPNPGDPIQSARSQYDFSTGLLTGFKDRNGIVTRTEYADPFDRPTLVAVALGTAIQNETGTIYAPASGLTGNDAIVFRDKDSLHDGLLQIFTHTDGFGRTIQEWTLNDPERNVEVETVYDGLGRTWKKSNPFRPGGGEAAVYTVTAYDLAGRVKQVDYPDGSAQKYGYAANTSLETDEAGKKRLSATDALARLTSITEDPDGLNHITSYLYDPLDDLIRVERASEVRTFSYDGLKRLVNAANPENGTVQYQYDGNGNVIFKMDAMLRQTGYVYDALNRIKSRTYGDGITPAVTYFYDTAPFGIGRPASVNSSGALTTYGAYDPMGRVLAHSQRINGQTYNLSYRYDLAGEMTGETYPSGRSITTGYNTAGKQNFVAGTLPGSSQRVYTASVGYTPHGAVLSLGMGNGLVEQRCYNSRLQPQVIRLRTSAAPCGSSPDAYDLLHLALSFGNINNNGNVLSQAVTVQNKTWNQVYTYDQLNRLATAVEGNPSPTWSQTYRYDDYGHGNRAVAGYVPYPQVTPQSTGDFETTNRLKETLGWRYDNAGNLTADPAGRTFSYDSDNRLIGIGGSVNAGYSYDGEGRRVLMTASGATTVMVHDIAGRVVAEYGAQALASSTAYLTQDHLGSTRIVTDRNGSLVARHDYLPFGEEIPSSSGGRSAVAGYGTADGLRLRFTGRERDSETGLDYFFARHYSGTQGRFLSPDEFGDGPLDVLAGGETDAPGPIPYADINNPQSLNKYTYALNNPLRHTDPDGHCPMCVGALVGAGTGAVASIISQKWAHPDKPIDLKKVAAATAGGAVSGATFGLLAAPATLTTIMGGTTLFNVGLATEVGAGAVAGMIGGVVNRETYASVSGRDLNQAIGTPGQIAADALTGAVISGLNREMVRPMVKEMTYAGRAVSIGEQKIAQGLRPSPNLPTRQAQLGNQQKVASAVNSTAVKSVIKREEERYK
jgi:RHS repeat-associated protein